MRFLRRAVSTNLRHKKENYVLPTHRVPSGRIATRRVSQRKLAVLIEVNFSNKKEKQEKDFITFAVNGV